MNAGIIVGLSISGVGTLILLVGLLFNLAANEAMSQPPSYDGIGGKDTRLA
jgi:hypothetical protein